MKDSMRSFFFTPWFPKNGVSQESILSAIQEGLRPSQFLHKISRKIPKTYVELKIKAFSHASADEYIKGKKGKPFRQKKDDKRK